MHAQTNTSIARKPSMHTGLMPVTDITPGRHFIRTDSPGEVLVLMSAYGVDCTGSKYTWAVVVATGRDSVGYVPGQLLKLTCTMLVRPVHEARAAVYALEQ